MRVLITGSNGLLGQKIVELCLRKGIVFLATSKGANRNPDCPESSYFSMDITNKLDINHAFEAFYPTHVIHTAAITNVDYCEDHVEECREVNVNAVRLLFQASRQFEAHFQLLSTDFVFDGKNGPYKETDAVHPLSEYARSKVAAEQLLQDDDTYSNWSIARTIIVYGTGNNLSRSNIVLWAIDSLQKGQSMTIVNDQFRMPTWAADLAEGCVEILLRDKKGIFHLSGPVLYSMYDLVLLIAQHLNLSADQVKPIGSDTLNQAAQRPPRTGFDLSKAKQELNYSPHTIEETLDLLKAADSIL